MSRNSIYGNILNTRSTPQTQPIPGREAEMVRNNAGGYTFQVDDFVRLNRFLMLGSEGGSYYAGERKLSLDNAQALLRCLKADGFRTVQQIVEVSQSGRAPKNDPAIFALAVAASQGDPLVQKHALGQLAKVCRIGTHLFHFCQFIDGMRGWGPALRKAVSAWYTERSETSLALQLAKYQQRDGWSHRDVLRKAHPRTEDARKQAALRWAVGQELGERTLRRRKENAEAKVYASVEGQLPRLIEGFERIKQAESVEAAIALVQEYSLPHECIPTQFKNDRRVWEALLPEMGLTALIRNLANMTRYGVFDSKECVQLAVKRLADAEAVKSQRVHPITVLMAQRTYAGGASLQMDPKTHRPKHEWTPKPQLIDALDEAFYLGFSAIEPTGQSHMLAIDVSGSMGHPVAGTRMSCCEGATAMAMATARTEQDYTITAFNNGIQPLPISAKSRLDDALRHTRNINYGGTDVSAPIRWALERKQSVDVFVVYTDSETYAGSQHVVQVLRQYRDKTGKNAKLIVVGMTATEFSVADPTDRGMLDVAGFDSSAPALMSQFAVGNL